jgi:cytochrome b involved in lipid metabolism
MHNKRGDAWAAFCGKVYNITPYLSFHPGGEIQLMRAAGRDGTKLFSERDFVYCLQLIFF